MWIAQSNAFRNIIIKITVIPSYLKVLAGPNICRRRFRPSCMGVNVLCEIGVTIVFVWFLPAVVTDSTGCLFRVRNVRGGGKIFIPTK